MGNQKEIKKKVSVAWAFVLKHSLDLDDFSKKLCINTFQCPHTS